MADESKSIALAILGIVAVLAVVGLVLMFVGAGATGQFQYSQPVNYNPGAGADWPQDSNFGGNPGCQAYDPGSDYAAYLDCMKRERYESY